LMQRFEDVDYQNDLGELNIKISGCINACGHHHVGHIGILGIDKGGEEFYQIQLGGSAGHDASLGQVLGKALARGEIVDGLSKVLGRYLSLRSTSDDRLIDELAGSGIAYVPFFPLGGFSPLQSSILSDVAARLGATPMQVALAWLLRRAPNILLIPGTSSVAHLRENLAAAEFDLPDDAFSDLERMAAGAAAA